MTVYKVSYRIVLLGGGECFWNNKIDLKHTVLGGSGHMHPTTFLINHHPVIECGVFFGS